MTVILDSPPYRLIAEPTTPAIEGNYLLGTWNHLTGKTEEAAA